METFVVRIAEAAREHGELHGIVHRVADGDEQPFHDQEQLLALLRTGGPDGGRAGTARA